MEWVNGKWFFSSLAEFPVGDELISVYLDPCGDEFGLPLRELPRNDIATFYIECCHIILIVDVDMRRIMLFWSEVHANDNPEKHGYSRHIHRVITRRLYRFHDFFKRNNSGSLDFLYSKSDRNFRIYIKHNL